MTILLYDLVGKDENIPFSPHCWKTKMCLAHLGLDYEAIPTRFVDIKDIENGGFSKVPVIKHGKNIISDSFDIALYLQDTYPDYRDKLFGNKPSIALSRFVESWSQTQLHFWIAQYAILDIWQMLDEESQVSFRTSREKMFKKTLEEIVENRDESVTQLKGLLQPIRMMLTHQPYIGGQTPLFADFIVFGAFQWLRTCSGLGMIAKDDVVFEWLNRMLDMHDGLGRSVPEATA
ncbi:MAG: glutathione S-transferase family protein [Nitratireductor sp.]